MNFVKNRSLSSVVSKPLSYPDKEPIYDFVKEKDGRLKPGEVGTHHWGNLAKKDAEASGIVNIMKLVARGMRSDPRLNNEGVYMDTVVEGMSDHPSASEAKAFQEAVSESIEKNKKGLTDSLGESVDKILSMSVSELDSLINKKVQEKLAILNKEEEVKNNG